MLAVAFGFIIRSTAGGIAALFGLLFAEPNCLPPPWRERAEAATERAVRARLVADYIAGMTDRFALDEHKRLFDLWS